MKRSLREATVAWLEALKRRTNPWRRGAVRIDVPERHCRHVVMVALSLVALVTAAGWQWGDAAAEGSGLQVARQVPPARQLEEVGAGDGRSAARRAQHHPTVLGVARGHTSWVASVAFHPGGGVLASGSGDGTAILWDITDPAHPRELAVLGAHTSWVNSVAFHPDGEVLASASTDRTVMMWDISDPAHPRQIGVLEGHAGGVISVAFHPEGEFMASSSRDTTVALWDVRDPASAVRWSVLEGRIYWFSVAFGSTGELLAGGSGDRTVVLWDLRTLPRSSVPAEGRRPSVRAVTQR